MADVLYDQMNAEGKERLQAARWDTRFRLTGEVERVRERLSTFA
jgi:hypothetical protein